MGSFKPGQHLSSHFNSAQRTTYNCLASMQRSCSSPARHAYSRGAGACRYLDVQDLLRVRAHFRGELRQTPALAMHSSELNFRTLGSSPWTLRRYTTKVGWQSSKSPRVKNRHSSTWMIYRGQKRNSLTPRLHKGTLVGHFAPGSSVHDTVSWRFKKSPTLLVIFSATVDGTVHHTFTKSEFFHQKAADWNVVCGDTQTATPAK